MQESFYHSFNRRATVDSKEQHTIPPFLNYSITEHNWEHRPMTKPDRYIKNKKSFLTTFVNTNFLCGQHIEFVCHNITISFYRLVNYKA